MPDLVGKIFGKYHIVERLGQGGMAEVYKAHQTNLDRYVAIKVVHAHLAEADPDFITRFEREAKAVASLHHPHIVQVYDYDLAGDMPYMVMEFIEGVTLKQYVDQLPSLPLAEASRIIREVGEALAYAHARGMVHRDVKPGNVMADSHKASDVQRPPRMILTDFGLAKMLGGSTQTTTGAIVGTPAYMAPEQGLGRLADHRADQYALSVMLFELVTGHLPYQADTPMALILQHVTAPTPRPRTIRPDLPEALDAFIFKCLAKEPDDRFPNMETFLRALLDSERGHIVTAPVSTNLTPVFVPLDMVNGQAALEPGTARLQTQPPPEPTLPPDVAGFVGRQTELDGLAQQLAQTHLVALSGMPGVGKTVLAAALARRVSEPVKTFWHSFHAGEDVSTLLWKLSAFLAWRRQPEVWNMLDSARQTRGQSAPPEVIMDYIFQLMRGQGYLLCLDDVHHIDDDPLFEHFLKRLQAVRRAGDLAIILTSRRVIHTLEDEASEPLTGLNAVDAQALLSARGLSLAPDLHHTLHTYTEGNPQLLSLAIEALRRAKSAARLLDDLLETPGIGDFLLKEVDKGLDADEREVMKGVAVLLGHPGTRDAIRAVLSDDSTVNVRRTLNDLVGRYLLMVFEGDLGREYDEHALVQAYYYDLLNKKERLAWHQRAAEYYETEEPNPLKAAQHYQHAGSLGVAMPTSSVGVGDFDRNGTMDIVLGIVGHQSQVYLNNGQGQFPISTTLGGAATTTSVTVGDINGDGALDIILGNAGEASQIYFGNGSGGFPISSTVGGALDTRAVATGDFDNDGQLDIVLGLYADSSRIYLSSSSFTTYVPLGGMANMNSVTVGDMDGDDKLDVVLGGPNLIYLNDTTTSFTRTAMLGGASALTYGVTAGDMNGDGRLDVALGNAGQASQIYVNNGSTNFALESTLGTILLS